MYERLRRAARMDSPGGDEPMNRLSGAIYAGLIPEGGASGAVTAWGLKDTSSRPPEDLGGALRRAA